MSRPDFVYGHDSDRSSYTSDRTFEKRTEQSAAERRREYRERVRSRSEETRDPRFGLSLRLLGLEADADDVQGIGAERDVTK